jgi:hypothetical protein
LLSEWLLRAFAALAAVSAVALLLGTNGFGLAMDDLPGAPREAFRAVHERTSLESSGAQPVAADPGLASVSAVNDVLGPMVGTSDGTRRASGMSNWVEVNGPVEVDVDFPNPSAAQKWSWVIVRVVPAVAVAAGLWLLAGLTRSARRGDPFTRSNVKRLMWITVLAAVGGVVGDWGAAFVRRWLLDTSEMAGLVPVDFSLSFGFVGLVLLLGVITGVWRRGVAMREDLEGLV